MFSYPVIGAFASPFATFCIPAMSVLVVWFVLAGLLVSTLAIIGSTVGEPLEPQPRR